MRTVLLANNRLGADVGRYLHERDELEGLVLHPPGRQQSAADLRSLGVPTWEWPGGIEHVRALGPECLLSVLFAYRVPEEWLALATWRALNLHPGLLPYNGGAAPNAWPLVDGTPAGTTLHVMDPTIDSGAILVQESVPTYPDDTAYTLYQRLESASLRLFREVWPRVTALEPRAQEGQGTYHRLADLQTLDLGPDDLHVLDRMRARTFPPYGAEFERDGRRYRVRVEIEVIDGD